MNLGRYEIVRELGKGAMGIVYLGKDPLIGRLVALKTIRIATVEDEETREFRERFVREAQAAGVLSHPSIVTVHDIGTDETSGTSYIAMEYVEGPNLKEILQQNKTLILSEIAEAIAQVAEALDYAHSKGIIHRDVKPANIILCGDSRAKITDFGIAKIASSAANLTSTGQFLGTPNYMAPEQIKGGSVDGRTDIFSLGIVLYEALTHRKPFGGDSLTTISYKIVHDTFLPLREFDPNIPEEFEHIVARCLRKDPGERYQRGRHLSVDLRNAVRLPGTPLLEMDDTLVPSNGRIPTIEIPFPEATGSWDASPRSGPRRAGISGSLRRAAPVLRKRVHPAVFIGVTLMLLMVFGATAWALWNGRAIIPSVDTNREEAVARQRALRTQADALTRQGNYDEALEVYRRLLAVAPNSPAVKQSIDEVEKLRIQTLSSRQRLERAEQKLEEGRKLMDGRQYEKAVPIFEEAFHLNPNSEEAVNYLRVARELIQLRAVQQPQVGGGIFSTAQPQIPQSRAATLNVVVRASAPDGYVYIRAGNQTLVHENLYQEGSNRRRQPKDVKVTRAIPAGTVDLVVAYVIPSQNVNEQKVVRETVEAGRAYTVLVRLERNRSLTVRVASV